VVGWEGAVFVGSYGGVSGAKVADEENVTGQKKDCNLIAATRAGSNGIH
jgi:hypothetical protein